jgi:hypothetical protein
MAVLPDADRIEIWREMMSDLSSRREATPFLKDELKAAVDAVDQWVSDNQASYNAALPEPFKSAASAAQKALLMQYVVERRYLTGV